jgi:hypothetical protein
MTVQFESTNPPASEADLERLRVGLGFEPPPALLAFLRAHDGARPEENDVDESLPGAEAGIGVDDFLGVDGVVDTVQRLGSRLRSDVVPIADAAGGNLVCMSSQDGSIWFWDHELEDADPLSRIADSLDAFLTMLRPFDIGNVEFTEEEKSGWVNPELLREMGVDPDARA